MLLLLRSQLVAELRYLYDLSASRSLPLYLDYFPWRVASPSSTPSALPASVPASPVTLGYEYYTLQQR